MDVELFAGLAVSDHDRGATWLEQLLGEPASFQPHDAESVWLLAEHRAIYVVHAPEHAGHSLLTVIVADLEAFVAGAAERGIEPDHRETYGNGVQKVTYRDPDGNQVGVGGLPAEEAPARS